MKKRDRKKYSQEYYRLNKKVILKKYKTYHKKYYLKNEERININRKGVNNE
jgi:hypothetical protein